MTIDTVLAQRIGKTVGKTGKTEETVYIILYYLLVLLLLLLPLLCLITFLFERGSKSLIWDSKYASTKKYFTLVFDLLKCSVKIKNFKFFFYFSLIHSLIYHFFSTKIPLSKQKCAIPVLSHRFLHYISCFKI